MMLSICLFLENRRENLKLNVVLVLESKALYCELEVKIDSVAVLKGRESIYLYVIAIVILLRVLAC